jgi:pantothenate kinase
VRHSGVPGVHHHLLSNMRTDLLTRARQLASGPRRLLGITGPPGSGKSTFAEELVRLLAPAATYLPMDGFHFPQATLRRLGRRDRMGAPDTFDAVAFVNVLREVRTATGDVLAPGFDRTIEEPVPAGITVPAAASLVVVEGNYLLLPDEPWAPVRDLLDEVWYLEPPDWARVDALIARHVAFGKSPEDAYAWVMRSDERNTALIAAHRDRADLVINNAWSATDPER